MNHLREFMEEATANRVLVSDEGRKGDESRGSPTSLLMREASNAVCFWVESIKNIEALSPVPELSRIPFPTVWVEFPYQTPKGTQVLVAILASQKSNQLTDVAIFTRIGGSWRVWVPSIEIDLENGVMFGIESFPSGFRGLTGLGGNINVLRAFCSAINCTNVTREEHKPSEKLQRARAKRGKQPLFSYWTLQIGGPRSSGERAGLGGSHASPRVHLRRGHPRQYAPGKWTWVQPCAVGDRAAGMVHKDYELTTP